jgi:hypothetical protein
MTSRLRNLSTLADEGGGGFSNLGTKSSHDDDIAVCYIIVLWRRGAEYTGPHTCI